MPLKEATILLHSVVMGMGPGAAAHFRAGDGQAAMLALMETMHMMQRKQLEVQLQVQQELSTGGNPALHPHLQQQPAAGEMLMGRSAAAKTAVRSNSQPARWVLQPPFVQPCLRTCC